MKTQIQSSFASSRLLGRIGKAALLGTLLIAGVACQAGLKVRHPVPTYSAHAQVGPSYGGASSGYGGGSDSSYAGSEYGGGSAYAAEPAYAEAAHYEQSGGLSLSAAAVIAPAGRLNGRVSKGAPRYYALDLAVGDSLAFTVYSRKLQGKSSLEVVLLEPDSVRLDGVSIYSYQPTTEYSRSKMQGTVKLAGRHILRVSSEGDPLEYRIDITSVNKAGY